MSLCRRCFCPSDGQTVSVFMFLVIASVTVAASSYSYRGCSKELVTNSSMFSGFVRLVLNNLTLFRNKITGGGHSLLNVSLVATLRYSPCRSLRSRPATPTMFGVSASGCLIDPLLYYCCVCRLCCQVLFFVLTEVAITPNSKRY
jgi:hypothetical protein